MDGDWIVSEEPPAGLLDSATQSHEMFSSAKWSPLLRALGATTRFAWSPSRRTGIQLAIFHRIGVEVGYLGFPVAGEPFDQMDDQTVAIVASQLQEITRLPILRVVRSGRHAIQPGETAAFPEVWIEELNDWEPSGKRLRKDLAFARRSSENLDIQSGCAAPGACHALYTQTVRSHGGNVRYTLEYFRRLAALADRDEQVGFYTAVDADVRIRGFAVVIRNQRTGYYLHGAVDAEYRKTGIGDLLVHRMICGAIDIGCSRLSMMASPWEQPGLHAYKMKWGASQDLVTTADHARGFTGRVIRTVTRFKARKARELAQGWNADG